MAADTYFELKLSSSFLLTLMSFSLTLRGGHGKETNFIQSLGHVRFRCFAHQSRWYLEQSLGSQM